MDTEVNPMLSDWAGPFGLPPFAKIQAGQFRQAFEVAMAEHRDELAAISTAAAPATFDNTLAAFDRAGRLLGRLEALFYNLSASATSPALQAVQRDLAGPLAAHESAVYQDQALFARIDAVYQAAHTLDAEQRRLAEVVHRDFQRAGAQLAQPQRERLAAVMQELAQATTAFAQNVLHDEAAYALQLRGEADLAGLPDFVRASARAAAVERGLGDDTALHVVTLSRSLIVPFLSFSARRDLREQAWQAWVSRGEHDGEHDNRPVAVRILALRREQAALMGHDNFADHALSNTMAQRRDKVWALLDEVWAKALPAFNRERAMLLQAMADAGATHELQPWDWRFWAERVRQQRFALDEAEVKPYFPLPAVVAAAFDCAQRLFGIRFSPRTDLSGYHPDVAVYEMTDAAGATRGLFMQDNFARPTKRSGAWMSSLRWQHANGGPALPVILNNNNFARGSGDQPALLSADDVRTLFHEFGHGLHGLLSDVRYERLSGTQVLRDFVELPSQLFEHWGVQRDVLRRHARHWKTGEPIPDGLIDRLEAAAKFGQGYETIRYLASSIVDMAAHERSDPPMDVVAFERELMAARGLPPAAGLNHRLTHFQHLFSGSGYAAGYYVYMWAEVLDADAWDAFQEAGDLFHAETAQRLLRCIYAAGGSVEPGETYRAFRGRDAVIEPMLRDRGLI
ncbi:MAG: M3 family metallopeptidase [Aquabacterium sp.]